MNEPKKSFVATKRQKRTISSGVTISFKMSRRSEMRKEHS
jgi:hypothetical protein